MRRALFALAVPMAIAALAGCGSSSSSSSSSSPASSSPGASTGAAVPSTGKTVVITYQNVSIQPANLTVKVGDKIKWANKDTVIHNVTGESGPLQLSSGTMNPGAAYTVTASAPGVVHYVCTLHPTAMIGTITITK